MASLVRWNPWGELFSLHDQLLSDSFTSLTPTRLPIDIRQTDDAFVIEASVPGFAPQDVEVTVDQNVLSIRANRQQQTEDQKQGWVRRERRQTSLFRRVGLPTEVRADEIAASFENGVLTVTVPRAQRVQPKRIPVSSGAPADPAVS